MADYGEAHSTDIGMSPAVNVLAVTIGGLVIIPPFVSLFRTGKRMQLAQRVASAHGGSAAVCLLTSLVPLVSIFAPAYLQAELNKVWHRRADQAAHRTDCADPGRSVGEPRRLAWHGAA